MSLPHKRGWVDLGIFRHVLKSSWLLLYVVCELRVFQTDEKAPPGSKLGGFVEESNPELRKKGTKLACTYYQS